MPIYKVTQQQGNRVITSTLEAKSLSSLQAFLAAASTAKIKYIYEVHFEDEETTPPIDDFTYYKQYKAFCKNGNRRSKQVLLHNVKKTMTESKLSNLIKTHLEVGGMKIDEVSCSLFME
ncbi:hypothetical protein [Campylobacter sp. RM16187]|uniref:hypothetical protein n=1 Tax=Campylobacter sp. RM16187 TaxID=1660063 RepID=UPI0021B5D16F|nr:hypothetical protein [Campylobacter sp. RM16187]QKG28768.1 hypothetical protein CDOMF_0486 [Campylobacter sp. RM16187]